MMSIETILLGILIVLVVEALMKAKRLIDERKFRDTFESASKN